MDSVLEILSPDTLEVVEEVHYCLDIGEQGPPGSPGPPGTPGNPGPQGNPGAPGVGVGVPTGGTAGQALQKVDATDYNTAWVTPAPGGVTSFNTRPGAVTLTTADVAAVLPAVGTPGTYGDATHYPVVTTDVQGRVSAVTLQTVAPGGLTSFNGRTDAAAVLTTADVTAVLPSVGTPGTYGDATHYPVLTTDAQGRVSAVTLQTVTSGGLTSFNGRTTAAAVLTSADVTGALGFSDFALTSQANVFTAAQVIRGGAALPLNLDTNNALGLTWLSFTTGLGANAYGSVLISATNASLQLSTVSGKSILFTPGGTGVLIASADVTAAARLDVRAVSTNNALCLDINNSVGPKWIEFTSAARVNTYGSISIDNNALSFKGTFNIQFLPASTWGCAFGYNNGGGVLPAMLNTRPGTTSQKGCAINGIASQTGVLLQLGGKSSTTFDRSMADVDAAWVDSTDATRKARVLIRAWDTAQREVMRGEADGANPLIGFLGSAAVGRQAVTGSRGSGAALTSLLTALANLGLITDSTTA